MKNNNSWQQNEQGQQGDSQKMTTSLQESMEYMKAHMVPDSSFDVVYRVIEVGGRQACIYFIDGFCKDELMMKILQYFIGLKAEDMPKSAYEMSGCQSAGRRNPAGCGFWKCCDAHRRGGNVSAAEEEQIPGAVAAHCGKCADHSLCPAVWIRGSAAHPLFDGNGRFGRDFVLRNDGNSTAGGAFQV